MYHQLTPSKDDAEATPALWQFVMEQDTSPWNMMLCFAVEHSKSVAALKKLTAAHKKEPRPITYQQLAEAAEKQRYRQFHQQCIHMFFRSKRPLTPPVSPSKRTRATKQKETDQDNGKAVAKAMADAPSAGNPDGDVSSESSKSKSESKGEGDSVSNAHSITSKASAQDKVNSKRKRVKDTAIELSSEEKDEVQKVLNQLLF